MIQVGDKVMALVSVRKGQMGKVVSIGANPALPVAVVFDDNIEWDFKHNELEVMQDGN